MKLSQSRGFLRIDSEILPDGIFYRERGLLSSHESKIPFEHIADDLIRTFHVPRLYLFISLFFALAFGYRLIRFLNTNTVSVPSLVWSGILFVVPALGTWMQSPHYIGYLTSRAGCSSSTQRARQNRTSTCSRSSKPRSDIFASSTGERPRCSPRKKKAALVHRFIRTASSRGTEPLRCGQP